MLRIKNRSVTTFCVTIAALCFGSAQAQVPGSFDTTPFPGFASGNGFIPALAIGINNDDKANAVALQADGKIVLAGTCVGALGTYFCIARLMPDGALDTSFIGPNAMPGNGKFLFTVASTFGATAAALALQPDGKILVAGSCSTRFCIARLNENGTFDTSFVGPTGLSTGNFSFTVGGFNDDLNAMVLQPDGKVVLVGGCRETSASTSVRMCAARLNADGSFDASFDGPEPVTPGNGRFLIPTFDPAPAQQAANAVAIRPSGKILMVGTCSPTTRFCAAQLNTNGTLDTTFDGSSAGNGKVKFSTAFNGPGGTRAFAVAIQPDDKAVIAGQCTGVASDYACAIRINSIGLLDGESFGDAGVGLPGAWVASGNFYRANAVAIQTDGKIVLVGALTDIRVSRLNSDSTADQSFDGPSPGGANGLVLLSLTTNDSRANSLAIQPDGKIVIAGECATNAGATQWAFCVARLNGGPFGARNCSLDIDGDGKVLATTDSLIHARIALGITGNAVIGGITFPSEAKRTTWTSIRSYLVTQCGMTLTP